MPAGDLFQRKINEIFQGLPSVLGFADDISVAEFDDLDRIHDVTLDKVLRICRGAKLKLNRDKFHLRCICIPFFREIIHQLENFLTS